jgi:hypothetical protein
MNRNKQIKILLEANRRFHRVRASAPFEEKIEQIIQLQKIDLEFSKHRKTKRAAFMRVWDIKR